MNQQCPNCHKMLTVPEQYAGQLMKCPMCNGTFTVSSLPQDTFPPASPVGPPEPAPAPPGESDVYGIRHEPEPAPPPPAGFPPAPKIPEPAPMNVAPPAGAVTSTPAPPAPPFADDYPRRYTVLVNPHVLEWVAVVSLVLVFLCQFFPWVGLYPGNVPYVTQNAWGAAFGSYGTDPDLGAVATGEKRPTYPGVEVLRLAPSPSYPPGPSILTIFYILLFQPVLILTVACLALNYYHVQLPPAVERLLPWRWGILAGLNLFVFLFLAVQLLVNFSLESHTMDNATEEIKKIDQGKTKTTLEQKQSQVAYGLIVESLYRTAWLRVAVLLEIVAIIAMISVYGLKQRGEKRPRPRMDVLW